jgi:hypothetical protein
MTSLSFVHLPCTDLFTVPLPVLPSVHRHVFVFFHRPQKKDRDEKTTMMSSFLLMQMADSSSPASLYY